MGTENIRFSPVYRHFSADMALAAVNRSIHVHEYERRLDAADSRAGMDFIGFHQYLRHVDYHDFWIGYADLEWLAVGTFGRSIQDLGLR